MYLPKRCKMGKTSFCRPLLVFFLGIQLLLPRTARLQTTPAGPGQRTVIEVLVELNKARGVYFLFSRQALGKKPVNPPVLNSGLSTEKILTQILKNTGLYYKKVDDRTFVILEKQNSGHTTFYSMPTTREFNDVSIPAHAIFGSNRI